MDQLTRLTTEQFLLFSLVLSRISGLVMVAPVFGSRAVPLRVRALLALALALVMAPTQSSLGMVSVVHLPAWLVLIAGELLVGLTLGLGTLLLFAGIQLSGGMISQMSGLALADVFNPSFDAPVPIFSELLYLCTLAVFMAIGGHRLVMAALLDTFANIPVGNASVGGSIEQAAALLLSQSFSLALQTAAPTVAAQLLANVVLGLVSRTLPQLNILALGFGLSSLVTFGMLAISLGAMAWAFEAQIQPLLDMLLEVFTRRGDAPSPLTG